MPNAGNASQKIRLQSSHCRRKTCSHDRHDRGEARISRRKTRIQVSDLTIERGCLTSFRQPLYYFLFGFHFSLRRSRRREIRRTSRAVVLRDRRPADNPPQENIEQDEEYHPDEQILHRIHFLNFHQTNIKLFFI